MISGLYLGELLRLVLLDMHDEKKVILKNQDVTKLRKQYSLSTEVLSKIECDTTENHKQIYELFKEQFVIELNSEQCEFVFNVARLIALRSARLSYAGIAAVMKKKGIKVCDVAAYGSLFDKYPRFKEHGDEALKEILDIKSELMIKVVSAEVDSAVGAAIIVAMSADESTTTSEGHAM